MEILIGIAVLGGLGLGFGLILSAASRVFHVETDPRLDQLIEATPGANCGGCGYAGCSAYAEAVLRGEAPVGRCTAGGDETAGKMAAVMGVEAQKVERQIAMVRCSGYKQFDENGGQLRGVKSKGIYEGLSDCVAASKVAGNGPVACKFGCLGFGSCVEACQYGALSVVDGVAKVDPEKCTGCLACVSKCPRHLIVPIGYGTDVTIACASTAKGPILTRACTEGCIGCGKCVKVCPEQAIRLEGFLATIDYTKCISCGRCAQVCPKHLIVDHKIRNDRDPIPAPNKF